MVTDARHMSSAWKATAEKEVEGARVGDYVEKGGEGQAEETDARRRSSDCDGAEGNGRCK